MGTGERVSEREQKSSGVRRFGARKGIASKSAREERESRSLSGRDGRWKSIVAVLVLAPYAQMNTTCALQD